MKAREVLVAGHRIQVLQQLGVDARSRVFAGDVAALFARGDLLRLPPEEGDPLQNAATGNLYFMAGVSAVGGTDEVGAP